MKFLSTSENSFGIYLRQLRKSRGLSQTELAKISESSQAHIAQLELGQRGAPSPDLIRNLASALKVTHIGLMIRAGYLTEEEVLTFRSQHGIND